jgi:hypothetical protein
MMRSALVVIIVIFLIAVAVFLTLGFTGWFDPWIDREPTPTPTITPTPTGTPSGVGPISTVQQHLFDLAEGPEAYEYVLTEITHYDWDAEYQEQHGCWEVYTSVGSGASIAHWYVYGIDTPNPAVYPMPGDPDATAIEHEIIELSAGY